LLEEAKNGRACRSYESNRDARKNKAAHLHLLRSTPPTRPVGKRSTTATKRLFRWFCLSLAQIVVGRSHLRAHGRAVGIEAFLGDDDNAALLTHLDDVEAAGRTLIHPVLAL